MVKLYEYFTICMTSVPDRMYNVNEMTKFIPELQVVEAIEPTEALIEKLKRQGAIHKRNGEYIDSFNRPYKIGSIGCFLSHKQLLKHISVNCKSKYAIILEDDIKLIDNFDIILREQITPKLDEATFDIAHLHIMDFQKKLYAKTRTPQSISFMRSPPGFCGTQCYVVRPNNLEKVLSVMQKFRDPIDEQLSRDTTLRIIHLVGLDMVQELNALTTTCKNIENHPVQNKVNTQSIVASLSTLQERVVPFMPEDHPFYLKLVTESMKSFIVLGQTLIKKLPSDTRMYMVDTFRPSAHQLITQQPINASLETMKTIIKDMDQYVNVILVPLTSIEAVEVLAHYRDKVDGIYHISEHDVKYHQLKLDIIFYWNILQDGGYIMGNNFDHPQVVKAVEEFANDNHLLLETHPEWLVWSLRKPLINITYQE